MRNDPDFKTKKSLGQNFLGDKNILRGIADICGAGSYDTVVEIGPGLGAVTDFLAERAGRVIAVELDDRLIPILRTKFALYPNVEIVHGDILKFDWNAALSAEKAKTDGSGREGSLRIVGNLPYYITTPILMNIFESNVPAESITVMVQSEVCDKITASPGKREYGVLSVMLQYYCSCRKMLEVPAECFTPRPKVDSAVALLERRTAGLIEDKASEKVFFSVVKKAFSQRRKTIVNSLVGIRGLEKAELEAAAGRAGIDSRRRPETLSVDEFINLNKEIQNAGY